MQGANPARATDIKEAAEAEWPFDADDWRPCGHPDDLTAFEASATGNLGAVLTEQELAHRLIRAIWVANGDYCEVGVSATRLEDMPYEDYRLDREAGPGTRNTCTFRYRSCRKERPMSGSGPGQWTNSGNPTTRIAHPDLLRPSR